MSPNTQPKIAIVTGAAQGIGKAIATQLANDRYSVVISDIAAKQSLMDDVAAEIKAKNADTQTLVIPADVSSASDVNNLVAKTKETPGGLDVMVANAGVCWSNSILDVTVEEWEKLFTINIRGVLLCYQAAARLMIVQKRGGRIIGHASSIAGKKGNVMIGAYSASKFAVRSLTQTAAREWGVHGITVNAFAPGTIDTPMCWYSPSIETVILLINLLMVREAASTAIALSGASVIDQVCEIFVSMLASEKSSYMTGVVITIDGGIWFD
ncbi:NAD(P)-binding protein [Pleurotus eryngii]|uniref:NAD(P)-binding protein n=1 Tax=Pleurotus eryngii TaxID=5323 RepID=A0A9P5ZW98_PLEER|nr:NAD(P)-binding protein [Pleurotus eryngii]